MVIHIFLHPLPFVLPNLRYKFPFRRDQPPVPLFYCYCRSVRAHRELRILKDEFNPSEIPLLELRIPLLIDPLDDRPEQIVFVTRYSDRISLTTMLFLPTAADYTDDTGHTSVLPLPMRSGSYFAATSYTLRDDTFYPCA